MSKYIGQIMRTNNDKDLYKVMGNICDSGELSPNIIDAFLAKGGNLNKSNYATLPYFWYIFKSRNISTEYIQGILDHIRINEIYYSRNILLHLLDWDFDAEYEDRILFIIEHTDIDIDYVPGHDFLAAVSISCKQQLYRIAEVLINAGANLYTHDDYYDTTCVSALIDHINDINDVDNEDEESNTIFNLLRLIIDKSDIDFLNRVYDNGFTVLSCYASYNRNEEILLLYNRGININDNFFVDAICENSNNEIFDLVMPRIDERNVYDPPSNTEHKSALRSALFYGNLDIAEKLLYDYKVNVNFYDNSGLSVLMDVVSGFSNEGVIFDAVKLLLNYNVDLKYEDRKGQTALFYVKSPNVLNLLVLYGADINHIDKKGHSVLYYAIRNYNHSLVRTILNFGPSMSGIESLIENNTPIATYVFARRRRSGRYYPKYVYDGLPIEHVQCLLEISWKLVLRALKEHNEPRRS